MPTYKIKSLSCTQYFLHVQVSEQIYSNNALFKCTRELCTDYLIHLYSNLYNHRQIKNRVFKNEHTFKTLVGIKASKDRNSSLSDSPELHGFLTNPRSRQAAVTILYSSRKIFKSGFVKTLSVNAQGNIIYSANRTRNIV